MAEGEFTQRRRARSNKISARLRLLKLTARVMTPPRGDAGVTTVRKFDPADAAGVEQAVRESVGNAGNVELLIAVTWKR